MDNLFMSKKNQDDQLIQLLSSYVNEAILIIRADDALCLYASPLVCQYLQSCPSTLQDKTLFEIDLDLRDFSQWQAYIKQIAENNNHTNLTRYIRQDETELCAEVRAKRVSFQHCDALLLTLRDVSSRRIYEQKVVTDDALRTFTLHEAQDGFWDWNLPDNSLYLSPHCFRLMGINQDELMGSVLDQWLSVIHPEDKKAAFQTIDDHVKGKTERFKIKYRLKQKQGDYIWVQGRGAAVERDEVGLPMRIIGSVIDITDSESTTQSLLWHAQYDALTKVYNRKKGYEFFHKYLKQAQQILLDELPAYLQVTVFDIDDFKQVNDQYGHLTGDALLQHFTLFVQNFIGSDMVLARWGGEEFVLLSYGRTNIETIRLVDQIVREFSIAPFKADADKLIYASVSAGISFLTCEQDSVASLFKLADKAMYQAKAQGKNRLCLA